MTSAPPSQATYLQNLARKALFQSRASATMLHAQRTKAIPEGAGKRIRAERAGTAPTKPAEAHPEYDDEHYSSN